MIPNPKFDKFKKTDGFMFLHASIKKLGIKLEAEHMEDEEGTTEACLNDLKDEGYTGSQRKRWVWACLVDIYNASLS